MKNENLKSRMKRESVGLSDPLAQTVLNSLSATGTTGVGLGCVGAQLDRDTARSTIQTRLVGRGLIGKILYRWLGLRVR